ncbi:hypothetical protein D3C87_1606860 [compost metagenome]
MPCAPIMMMAQTAARIGQKRDVCQVRARNTAETTSEAASMAGAIRAAEPSCWRSSLSRTRGARPSAPIARSTKPLIREIRPEPGMALMAAGCRPALNFAYESASQRGTNFYN